VTHSGEPTLIGRTDLVDELAGFADAVTRGSGAVVLLTGDAGIGKTSVVRTLANRVRDRVDVSWGACAADGSAPPLWPWRALIRPGESETNDTESAIGASRYERLSDLRDRLRAAGEDQPLIHVIEDIQWADVTSVLLLGHLAIDIARMSVLIIATLRTGEPRDANVEAALEEVRRSAHVREVGSLSRRDIADLVRRFGLDPKASLVADLEAHTGGNPLFLSELLRARQARTNDPTPMGVTSPVPSRVVEVVDHRLARLPTEVADLLVTASVLGTEGEVATLARTHGVPSANALDLLDQAQAAHFVDLVATDRWRYRHAIIRDAVYGSAASVDRTLRHVRALEMVACDPLAPAALLAHHAIAALPASDTDRAVALAARAGEEAFDQHAYEEAISWFERALAAAPLNTHARWRAELEVLAGEALRHTGDMATARTMFESAFARTDDPSLVARAALGHGDPGADLGIAYRAEHPRTAELLERAIELQPNLDSLVGVQLEARLAAELHFSDHPERARRLATSALSRAHRLGHPRALTIAGSVHHDAFVVGQAPLDRQLAGSAELLDWSRLDGSVAAQLTAHRARVIDLLGAGDVAAMDAEVVAFGRLADPLRAPGYHWWTRLWSAMRALLEGRHDLAEQRALAAYEAGAAIVPELAFVNLSFLLFFLRREQGRLAEMESATREYAATHADVPALRAAHAFLLAESGRVDDAAGALSSFDDAALEQLHDRNWPASWFQLARVAFAVQDRVVAAKLLDAHHRPTERCVQVSLGTVCLGASDLAAAWLFETIGDLDAADQRYRSAADLNARIGARSWLAQTRVDHARLLTCRDEPGDHAAAGKLRELARSAAREIGLATIDFDRADPGSHRSADARGVFVRDGATWRIGFADRQVTVPDARGLRDLAYLLRQPGEAVSALELEGDAARHFATDRGSPTFDERARREIRERLRALDVEEADAESVGDRARETRAREARQELAEAVARDLGMAGRARRVGDPVERARKTVSTRLRRTIASLGRTHPELGRHLERSIDTGAWCAYRPAERIDWET
jgi:tetratricopeptide (TPR) repeat protein